MSISRYWQQRARIKGQQIVDSYAAGNHPISKSYDERGIAGNVALQTRGRLAEIGAVLTLRGNPETALDWGDRAPRYDFRVRSCSTRQVFTVDVKTAETNSPRYLLWPRTKRGIMGTRGFADVLLLVAVDEQGLWTMARPICYAHRAYFLSNFHTAGPGHALTLHTPYLHRSECSKFARMADRVEVLPWA